VTKARTWALRFRDRGLKMRSSETYSEHCQNAGAGSYGPVIDWHRLNIA
jgi:hypothetical protein